MLVGQYAQENIMILLFVSKKTEHILLLLSLSVSIYILFLLT